MRLRMILLTCLVSVLTVSLGHDISLPEAEGDQETQHRYDVYRVHEGSGKSFSFISPKSGKPTLREIIYYHIIEKPYSGDAGESPQTGLGTDDAKKTFTNSHGGNQFSLDGDQVNEETAEKGDPDQSSNAIDPRYGDEHGKDAKEMDNTMESNDEGEETGESDLPENEDEVITENDSSPKKSVTRKLLFDIAKEKYSRKPLESDNPSLQRNKRATKWSMPEAPRLPDIDLDSLPSYVRNMLSSHKKTKKAQNHEEKSRNELTSALTRLSDRKENREKSVPKTYGMEVNNDAGVVWNQFLRNGIFNVGRKVNNEKKKRNTAHKEVLRTARTLTSDSAPGTRRMKEEATRAPRTYGMNLTNGEGYTWNELVGLRQPALQENVDNKHNHENKNTTEDSKKEFDQHDAETVKPAEKSTENEPKSTENVAATVNTTVTVPCDKNAKISNENNEKVDMTERPSENTTSALGYKTTKDTSDTSTESILDNDKLPDWLALLTEMYMDQMLENIKTLVNKAVDDRMGERNTTKGTPTDNLTDKEEIHNIDGLDSKLENDLDENDEPTKDKPTNDAVLPTDTEETKVHNDENLNLNVTNENAIDVGGVNGSNLPKDNITATNNSAETTSNGAGFNLRDFRDNYFEFVESKSKNNNSNDNGNKAPLPIAIGANTLIGNSVGNDKVTNIFIFYPNEEVSELIEELKASHGKDDKSLDISKFSESDSEDNTENSATEAPENEDDSVGNTTTVASSNEGNNTSTNPQDNISTTTTKTVATSESTTETVPTTQSTTELVEVTSTTTEKIESKQESGATSTSTTENPSTTPATQKSTTEKSEASKDNASTSAQDNTSTTPSTAESIPENNASSADSNAKSTSKTDVTSTTPATQESTTEKSEDNKDIVGTSAQDNTSITPLTTLPTTERNGNIADANDKSTPTPNITSSTPATTASNTEKVDEIKDENTASSSATENTTKTEVTTEKTEATSTTEITSTTEKVVSEDAD